VSVSRTRGPSRFGANRTAVPRHEVKRRAAASRPRSATRRQRTERPPSRRSLRCGAAQFAQALPQPHQPQALLLLEARAGARTEQVAIAARHRSSSAIAVSRAARPSSTDSWPAPASERLSSSCAARFSEPVSRKWVRRAAARRRACGGSGTDRAPPSEAASISGSSSASPCRTCPFRFGNGAIDARSALSSSATRASHSRSSVSRTAVGVRSTPKQRVGEHVALTVRARPVPGPLAGV